MKVVFFGIPDLGLVCLNSLLQNNINIVGVIPPCPSHAAHNVMVNFASGYNKKIVHFNKSPKEIDFIQKIKNLEPDLGVVCAFDHLLPDQILGIPKLGFVNCHPSLLPQYRGGNPYFHVIANNEQKTGVTFHYMDSSFDTGKIIVQKEVNISPAETFGTLFSKLNSISANMLVKVIKSFEQGHIPEGIDQKNIEKGLNLKKAPNINIEKGDCFINWSNSAQYIERFVRALNPIWGATTFFRSTPVKFWSGYCVEEPYKAKTPVGTIVDIAEDRIGIQTAQGIYYPKSLHFVPYFITDVEDFIGRTNPQLGEVFGK